MKTDLELEAELIELIVNLNPTKKQFIKEQLQSTEQSIFTGSHTPEEVRAAYHQWLAVQNSDEHLPAEYPCFALELVDNGGN